MFEKSVRENRWFFIFFTYFAVFLLALPLIFFGFRGVEISFAPPSGTIGEQFSLGEGSLHSVAVFDADVGFSKCFNAIAGRHIRIDDSEPLAV